MGRPKLTNTKDTFLHIRINKNERQNVGNVCLKNNLSLSSVARQGIKKEIENIELNNNKNFVRELEDLIFISSSITNTDAEQEVLEIIITFREWLRYLILGTTKIPKSNIFKIRIYKFNYEKLKNFKDAITQFLDKEEEEDWLTNWLTDKQLEYFKEIENWLQEILNRYNNKTNSAPETKVTEERLAFLPTDADAEDSGLDTSTRRKSNQSEF